MTLEDLLNTLIQGGWKPRWIYTSLIVWYWLVRCEEFVWSPRNEWKSYRELLSIESWFWQFVCEKELVYRIWHDEKTYKKRKNDDWETKFAYSSDYWIIQSSLCNEEDLEKFLLENIKIS